MCVYHPQWMAVRQIDAISFRTTWGCKVIDFIHTVHLNIAYFNLLFIHYVCITKVLTGHIWRGGSSLSFIFIHQQSIITLIWSELLLPCVSCAWWMKRIRRGWKMLAGSSLPHPFKILQKISISNNFELAIHQIILNKIVSTKI